MDLGPLVCIQFVATEQKIYDHRSKGGKDCIQKQNSQGRGVEIPLDPSDSVGPGHQDCRTERQPRFQNSNAQVSAQKRDLFWNRRRGMWGNTGVCQRVRGRRWNRTIHMDQESLLSVRQEDRNWCCIKTCGAVCDASSWWLGQGGKRFVSISSASRDEQGFEWDGIERAAWRCWKFHQTCSGWTEVQGNRYSCFQNGLFAGLQNLRSRKVAAHQQDHTWLQTSEHDKKTEGDLWKLRKA